MLRAAGLVLDLHAQAADVHVNDLHIAEIIFAPDTFQDFFTHQRGTRIAEEQLHNLELDLRQVDGLAGLVQNAALFVQHKRAADQLLRLLGGPGGSTAAAVDAAGQRLQTRDQLRHRKRLRNVIVCADGQATDLVALLPFGRHDDNADVAVTAADRLAEAQAVHARQHNIQKCRVAVFPAVHQFQRALGTGGLDDLPAGHFQVQGYHFADAGFVFDYQNSFHKPDFPFCINLIPAAPCSG